MTQVLHLSTSDIQGGAARAAYRLHQGLQSVGVHSTMLVQEKRSIDKTVVAPRVRLAQGVAHSKLSFDALPLKLYPQRDRSTLFSPQWLPDRVPAQINRLQPDLINLHWINGGFIQIETLARMNRPLFWTIHDMWAFTGGCHYASTCDRYTQSCGQCPQISSSKDKDLSRWIWRRKAKGWKNLDLTIISPSAWLAQCARSSRLFCDLEIEHIPNGLDTEVYRPIDRQVARNILQLPQDKHLILFGSLQSTQDQRKGFHLLQPALKHISHSQKDHIELLVLGASQPEKDIDVGFKTHYLGTLNDDISLAIAYSAADLFVLPSIEDNLPNTVIEAFACGIPCVTFKLGGFPDMVEHHKTGYLVQPFDIKDLANGIMSLLEHGELRQQLAHNARQKAEREYSLGVQAQRYLEVYERKLYSPASRLSTDSPG
jgi:glycosyltransferase involved in cell wall biosynthesis